MVTNRINECRKHVVNFTEKSFYAYACDGTPILVPAQEPEDEIPSPDDKRNRALVVDEKQYLMLREQGRTTHDLARLSAPSDGVDGLPMQSIFDYDTNTRIMPTNGILNCRCFC